jgi:integrase
MDEYITYRSAMGDYNDRTAITARRRLMKFAAHTDKPLADMTEKDVRDWLTSMDVRPSTLAACYSALNTFMQWLCGPKVVVGENRSLTASEVEAVRHEAQRMSGVRGQLLFSLLHGEALRVAEVAAIQVEDIDFDNNSLYVRGKGYQGKRSRRVPMSPNTAKFARRYMRLRKHGERGPLLRKQSSDEPLNVSRIGEIVTSWMQRAGVKQGAFDGVSAHALRHTAAEEIAASTDNVRIVQAMLGHKNLATTQTYLRRDVDGLDDVQAARFS